MFASQIIKVAAGQVGYIGKKTNQDLDDFTANITGKYTKYARDLNNAGYYNGDKNGFAWCTVFFDWCIWEACGRNKAEAEKVKPVCSLGASCTYAYNYYEQQGRTSGEPSIGAQIFYKNSSGFTHTGIVAAVHNDSIETIEGNWKNSVAVRSIMRNDSSIAGYGLPYYEPEPTDGPGAGYSRIADLFEELAAEFRKLAEEPDA